MIRPIQKNPARVAVGMSGGLDSSVVAALLTERRFEVIGLTLHLFKEGSRCCSEEDIERSRRVCAALGIRHYTVNAVQTFEERIIRPFVAEYARGLTPSPCVVCNQQIKFGALQERALLLGCDYVATGHYVRVTRGEERFRLLRGRDAKKDQSYFLHRLSQRQLAHSLFPLESWEKRAVAQYAREHELPVSTSSKAESQDLCFVSDAGHSRYIESRRPELKRKGPIVATDGSVLGEHQGIHRYTVGQRRGLGVAATAPLYVKEIDATANRIVVGSRDEVTKRTCRVRDMHWIAGSPPAREFACAVRVRYRHRAAPARVRLEGDGDAELEFDAPQFAITPGQAAVCYHGDEVLGGGWIAPERMAV